MKTSFPRHFFALNGNFVGICTENIFIHRRVASHLLFLRPIIYLIRDAAWCSGRAKLRKQPDARIAGPMPGIAGMRPRRLSWGNTE